MKTRLLLLLLLLWAVGAQAASYVYPVTGGAGGSVTGAYNFATTQFSLVNNTNVVLKSGAVGTNIDFYGTTEWLGNLVATQGVTSIELLNDGGNLTIGAPNAVNTVSNNAGWYNNGLFEMNVSGQFANFKNSASIRVFTGSIVQMDSGSRLELDYATADRVMVTGPGSMATNHPHMRLASSLSGVSDGQALKYDAASGTWTNATDSTGSASPVGGSTAIQLDRGGAFFGTNGSVEKFIYTNGTVTAKAADPGFEAVDSGAPNATNRLAATSVGLKNNYDLGIQNNGSNNFVFTSPGHLNPATDNAHNVGSPSLRVGELYAMTIGATTFTNTVHPLVGASSTVTLYDTNAFAKWYVLSNTTFAVDVLRSNIFHYVETTNAAFTITWPSSLQWRSEQTLTTAPSLQNGRYLIKVWKDDQGTNASVIEGPQFALVAGYKTEFITNASAGTITAQTTQRYTNYADGNITINCATDVTANWTNAVAGNRNILLTNAVIGTSFNLGLVSDSSARTLALFAGPAMTWLSTNDTSNATNILTTASKRSLLCGRVGMGTDGVSTNIQLWVKNQTP